jgi:hypothetical protein
MHDLALRSSGDASGTADSRLFGLSLCSGAGGLDLGLAIAIPGYRAVGHVERETYAAATLVARMEDASLDKAVVWDDVGNFDGRPWRGAVDIVTSGYPCQAATPILTRTYPLIMSQDIVLPISMSLPTIEERSQCCVHNSQARFGCRPDPIPTSSA